MLIMHNQFKVFHWQTQRKPGSFAQHEAFGKAYDDLTDFIDDFVEIYQVKNGVILANGAFNVTLYNLGNDPEEFVDEFVDYLTNVVPQGLEETDTDLLNIRDEMLGILNQTKYRLHLI
jgi:DNA-binding ferritin-like protein